MRHSPKAAHLLDIARTVLRNDLLPELPDEYRYDALMVANAMAIAMRHLENGDQPLWEEYEEMAALLERDDSERPQSEKALEKALEALDTRLSAEIRAGSFDPENPDYIEARDHLIRKALRRVAESNPRYLAHSHLSGEGWA